MILHGTADSNPLTPFAGAERLRDAAQAAGIPTVFYAIPGADHGAWTASVKGKNISELAWNFLQVYGNKGSLLTRLMRATAASPAHKKAP